MGTAKIFSFPGEALEADGHGVVVGAEDGGVVLQDYVVDVEVASRFHVVANLVSGESFSICFSLSAYDSCSETNMLKKM